MKPGVSTSEFLLTLLANVGYLAASLAGVLSPHWAAIASTVSTGAYALSRGWAKTNPAAASPVVLPVPVNGTNVDGTGV